MTCSAESALDEPLPGTAAQVARWLCVEHPGAWGRDVLGDAVLGAELSTELARRTDAAGVRVMLIRKPGRTAAITRRTVLLASSVPGRTWCERIYIDSLDELLAIDLNRMDGPAPGIGTALTEPVILVCAHGKRDQCCARLGRPIAATLGDKFPHAVWECSHTGGHRFAPSMIVLPTGYTYGRLDAERSEAVVAEAMRGVVSVDGLRGRSAYQPGGQAAEVAIRQVVSANATDLEVDETGETPLILHRDGRRWQAILRTWMLPPRPVSCGAAPKPVSAVAVETVVELDPRKLSEKDRNIV